MYCVRSHSTVATCMRRELTVHVGHSTSIISKSFDIQRKLYAQVFTNAVQSSLLSPCFLSGSFKENTIDYRTFTTASLTYGYAIYVMGVDNIKQQCQ